MAQNCHPERSRIVRQASNRRSRGICISSKLLTCVLLGIVVALPVAAQSVSFLAAAQSAGCDEHGGTMPSHPASYACCQGAHDAVALQRTFSVHDLFGDVFLTTYCPLSNASLADLGIPLVPLTSDSPPLLISLRI